MTGLCVIPSNFTFTSEMETSEVVLRRQAERSMDLKELAETYLTAIEKKANEAGVGCDVVYERNDSPYSAIIRVTESYV